MGWEHRKGKTSIWHEHTMKQYETQRDYLPDFVPRDQWGAAPPFREAEPLKHPVKHMRFVFTQTEKCNSLEECSSLVRRIQKEHFEMGMADIGYNFLIGGDGRKYEGRGWTLTPEKPGRTKQSKKKAFHVALIGNETIYSENLPNVIRDARQDLLHYGITKKYIKCCHDVYHDAYDRTKLYRE